MEPPVVPFDLQRMFLGDAPPMFLLEILVRTIIVYVWSLAVIRWIGGRGIGQMSVVEFLLVVALGSAVGDAMFYPDVPLTHALLVITVVGLINKLIDIGMSKSPFVRRMFSGATVQVVRDGLLVPDAMRHARLNRDEVFEGLREHEVSNLGQVRHAFLETSGHFSIFRAAKAKTGLDIVPAWDVEPPPIVPPDQGRVLCTGCGADGDGSEICKRCGSSAWTPR